MRLSYRTIEALFELSKVSPTVLIRRAGDLFTFDPATGIRATAAVADRFPRDVAFDDIRRLLGALDAVGPTEADITFDAARCSLTSPTGQFTVAVANARKLRELLRHRAEKRVGDLHSIWEFTFGHKELRALQKLVKRIKKKDAYEMRLESDGVTASLTLRWKSTTEHQQIGGLGSFQMRLGRCAKSFACVFPVSALSPLPSDDYDAALTAGSKMAELRLAARTRPITYAASLTVSTVETRQLNASREA